MQAQIGSRLGHWRLPDYPGILLGLWFGLMGCTASPEQMGQSSPDLSPSTTEPPAVASTPTESDLGQHLPVTATAILADSYHIDLEVAATSQQQAFGLMYRSPLPDDRGMLFPFDPPRPVSFWMKNVPGSLDMIFIYQGEIKAIASNVPPCDTSPCPTYGPERQVVDAVIELRGGRAAELGLQVGDSVTITFLDS
ncbi:hypothetical protein XM38_048260 [Halomicronema hongdechloris C2206]|uniref:DUF192 domain-containing protein n=1 Tax=Halomicronema hongdechloris C2206 TaxID=1641165 RepID=A0A1Z3HUB2_9CYAN|nr:DUF192 domain-containing protein [Halomicronema hongdechloris]ASC73852.1 hypothetical protein XM38_048260 [Halomicronema hongdechloris C2206]